MHRLIAAKRVGCWLERVRGAAELADVMGRDGALSPLLGGDVCLDVRAHQVPVNAEQVRLGDRAPLGDSNVEPVDEALGHARHHLQSQGAASVPGSAGGCSESQASPGETPGFGRGAREGRGPRACTAHRESASSQFVCA
eukprot:96236-Rhodomonas_salina.4